MMYSNFCKEMTDNPEYSIQQNFFIENIYFHMVYSDYGFPSFISS